MYKNVIVTRPFAEMFRATNSIIVQRGGARSSKTHSIIQYLLWRLTNEPNCKILVTRKTMPALKITVYKDFVDLLKAYGYYQYCDHSLSNHTITYRPNNAFVAFISIDNPERIKSSEWNVIHLEEANEYKYRDFTILKTRLSAPTAIGNKLILSLNPESALHWIKQKVVNREKDCLEIVSNYKDNPFLSKEYIQILEDLQEMDLNAYNILALGEWGVLSNVIYSNYVVDDKPEEFEDKVYAIDFGYNAPTSVVYIGMKDEEFYIKELLYESKLTNDDLIEKLKYLIKDRSTYIYADNAEPARIEAINRAGFNIHPANKSVKDGIDFIRSHKLHIRSNSVNTLKEIGSYKYRENKDGEVLEEPVKFNDHIMDAMRYGIYTHFGIPRQHVGVLEVEW